jgi:predicted phage tail component-like protein
MAESIVKVPSREAQGLDFLAFSFNGKHSWDDFHIYRTSDGERYNENLTPTLADKTAEMPGGDGMYYFGTTHGQRDFNISFAFDSLTEVQLRELKKWLNGKEMGDLWFQEAPYKVWTAKPAGNSSIKYIPFDDFDKQGNKIRVYKGEGSI